jgi:hypothetical protein
MGTRWFSVTSFAPTDHGGHHGDVRPDEVHNLTNVNAPRLVASEPTLASDGFPEPFDGVLVRSCVLNDNVM